jgi:hypothetical protein
MIAIPNPYNVMLQAPTKGLQQHVVNSGLLLLLQHVVQQCYRPRTTSSALSRRESLLLQGVGIKLTRLVEWKTLYRWHFKDYPLGGGLFGKHA